MRQTLSITCTRTAWVFLPSMSVCPHSPCSPPTQSRLWHWPACGKAETFPFVWLQHPGSTLATIVEKPSYCTSTARGQQLCYRSTRGREGGRGAKGGSQFHSAPLLWPHQPGQGKSQLLSHHPGGLLLHATSPQSLLNVPEERGGGYLVLSWSLRYHSTR